MRVLHVTEAAVGGIATYLNELLLPQMNLYRDPGAVGLLLPESELPNLSSALVKQVSAFTYLRRGRDPASLLRLAVATRRVVREFEPDIVHVHSSFAGLVARLLPMRVPIIYSPHGWAFDIEDSGLRRLLYIVIERSLANRAAAIVNVSEFERHSGLSAGLPQVRLRLVRTGISISPPPPENHRLRNGPFKLLFVGRFDHEKGLPWFLEVFSRLPVERFSLIAIGAHVREQKRPILSKGNFHVFGWTSQEALNQYYDDADLVVVPSRWEAFGLVAVEAMRRGCPVLASDRGALPELLAGADCGVNLPLENPEAWRQWLLALNHDQLANLGRNSRQHFINRFTSAGMVKSMHQIYQEIING